MLEQNFPNPFNPTTIIRYYLPQKAPVILEVLDVTGRTVEKLVDNIESIGEHTVTYNGSSLSSGTYLYRLKTSTGYEQT
ncbi:MAG: T9SS type A sorting domain-containing protein, partial [candidate division WOR-3 bacterium]